MILATPSKTVTQSRTNRTAAAIVGVVIARVLAKYLPSEIAKEISGILSDEIIAAVVSALGVAVVYFHQASKPVVVDKQDVVTPRP